PRLRARRRQGSGRGLPDPRPGRRLPEAGPAARRTGGLQGRPGGEGTGKGSSPEVVLDPQRVGAAARIGDARLPAGAAGPVVLVGAERRVLVQQVLDAEGQAQPVEPAVGGAVVVGDVAVDIRVPLRRDVVAVGDAGGLLVLVAVAVDLGEAVGPVPARPCEAQRVLPAQWQAPVADVFAD